MLEPGSIRGRCGSIAKALCDSYKARDDASFERAVAELDELTLRAAENNWAELGTRIRTALEPLREDPRLGSLVGQDMRDARSRLDYVIQLTSDAAHKTLELIEKSVPMLERTVGGAADLLAANDERAVCDACAQTLEGRRLRVEGFLRTAIQDLREVRRNLGEVLIAQGYQDLSGQLIRRVIEVVVELESDLDHFLQGGPRARRSEAQGPRRADNARGSGPAVPGVSEGVSAQVDVDELLLMGRSGGQPDGR